VKASWRQAGITAVATVATTVVIGVLTAITLWAVRRPLVSIKELWS
jgi:hypothetical protein